MCEIITGPTVSEYRIPAEKNNKFVENKIKINTMGQSWTVCITPFPLGGIKCVKDTWVENGGLKGQIIVCIINEPVFKLITSCLVAGIINIRKHNKEQ